MKATLAFSTLLGLAVAVHADLITAVPGPDDQGGMLMPMVSIAATSGTGANPTAGTINISFSPASIPVLKSTEEWSPGDWYDDLAAWRTDLGSPAGVGGTPPANAGNGDLFNNQHGFMFMSMSNMMMAAIPAGNSLAIRLDAVSSPLLEAYNYGNAANRWDPVFGSVGSQVLWNGSMWHNYFTLPANAPAGDYTAEFTIFMASTPFTGSTGFAQYDSAASTATANTNFIPATVTYNFTVVPEPSALLLCGVGLASLTLRRPRHRA